MNNIILFDDETREDLLPLTYTRPIGEIRIGILTIKEKWEIILDGNASYITQDYLAPSFPIEVTETNYVVNGSVLPSEQLGRLVQQLEHNEALLNEGELIAAKLGRDQFEHLMKEEEIDELAGFELGSTPMIKIHQPYDIFRYNGEALRMDFEMLTAKRKSKPISFTNRILGEDNIFIEEGATIECASLNGETGPIYIGKNAVVMEGALIRGPFALCDNSVVKMGAKIYGPTTIGPQSKVGGEINNSVIFGNSNKAHDGFLGNSIIGEWCNLGADTNNSNLKNNYAEVKLWNYPAKSFLKTGLQFCGLVMGDHSKCGINTMFNTGTVVGVSANIFGDGFPRNFIPSFSWGGTHGFSTYAFPKATETVREVMKRRDRALEEHEEKILQQVFDASKEFRAWEKN